MKPVDRAPLSKLLFLLGLCLWFLGSCGAGSDNLAEAVKSCDDDLGTSLEVGLGMPLPDRTPIDAELTIEGGCDFGVVGELSVSVISAGKEQESILFAPSDGAVVEVRDGRRFRLFTSEFLRGHSVAAEDACDAFVIVTVTDPGLNDSPIDIQRTAGALQTIVSEHC